MRKSKGRRKTSLLRRSAKIAVFSAFVLLALGYSLILYRVHRDQEAMLFPAYGPDYTECTEIIALGYRPVKLQQGAETVRMLWWKAPQPKGTILLFHGNGGTVCYRAFHAERLRNPNWNVVLAEYPGYGRDSGSAGERFLLKNALAVYDSVVEASGKPIIVFGKSLGSGPATYVAAQRAVAGLILHTPYPSLNAIADRVFYRLLPVRLLNRHPMNASDWAVDVRAEVLAIHGDKDTLIPIDLGIEQIGHFKKHHLVTIPGADHNTLAWQDERLYWGSLRDYCVRIFGLVRN